jgi:hypothetical protein
MEDLVVVRAGATRARLLIKTWAATSRTGYKVFAINTGAEA